MERLGREPDPTKAPLEVWHFPAEVQQAFAIHSLLPDKWDGMNGVYMGKDWAALSAMLDIFSIERNQDVVIFLKYIEHYNTVKVNDRQQKARKAKEAKDKRVGTKAVTG
jgi:hypothetical protein